MEDEYSWKSNTHPGDDGDNGTEPSSQPQASFSAPPVESPRQNEPDAEQQSRHQLDMSQTAAAGMLDMSSMAAALPSSHPFPQQFQAPTSMHPSLLYQFQQGVQFPGQSGNNAYGSAYPQQYQPHFMNSQQHVAAYPPFVNHTAGMPFQNHGYLVQPQMYHNTAAHQHVQPQPQPHPHPQTRFSGPYGTPAYGVLQAPRTAAGYPVQQMRNPGNAAANLGDYAFQQPSAHGNTPAPTQIYESMGLTEKDARRRASNSSLQPSALRGPPRKPKQSGHALWVGNLPPTTHIIPLKDHFSREATDDIESVFLISKSNCAFVNYKSEASCAAAMSRFHDSRFQGVRLVCRLRRGSAPAAGPPPQSPRPQHPIDEAEESPPGLTADPPLDMEAPPLAEAALEEKVKEKFFVVKSLTVEDLERSVLSGIWATQAHNEVILNNGYQVAEDVYLIFSANKSGEYYGYARMESAIDDESAAGIDYQPRTEATTTTPSVGAPDLPITIPTPATATAPRGRIIDDSARGTIFWEAIHPAESRDKEGFQGTPEDDASSHSGDGGGHDLENPGTPQTFGKPFKIKWMSTDRLPFYRTRGLRNPWNANREIKIARDGTEIEPTVGRRLVNMFHHRPPGPTSTSTGTGSTTRPTSQQPPPHGSAPGGMYGQAYQ